VRQAGEYTLRRCCRVYTARNCSFGFANFPARIVDYVIREVRVMPSYKSPQLLPICIFSVNSTAGELKKDSAYWAP